MSRKSCKTHHEDTSSANPYESRELRHHRDELDRYIDFAKKSSTGPRVILLLIHLAVAVAFFAFWNARQNSWTNLRISKIQNALLWVDRDRPGADASIQEENHYRDALAIYRQFRLEVRVPEADAHGEDHSEDDEFERAKIVKFLEQELDRLERVHNDNIRIVEIPVIGVRFDINDLGLFSGFLLVVIVTMFRFSIIRELENTELAYGKARELDNWMDAFIDKVRRATSKKKDRKRRKKKAEARREQSEEPETQEHRKICFELISMDQLVLSPPVRGPVEWYWRHAYKVGLCLPFVIQSCILAYDVSTAHRAFVYGQEAAIAVLMISFTSVGWILFMTIHSFLILGRMERFWQREGRRLGYIEAPDPLDGRDPDPKWNPKDKSLVQPEARAAV